tara:strand:+ start:3659 stop:3868 length:210 start_codon:yes stop_codon:yes gene_type:complete
MYIYTNDINKPPREQIACGKAMDEKFVIINIIWLIALLSLKYFKDVTISRLKYKIRTMEEIWTIGRKKK